VSRKRRKKKAGAKPVADAGGKRDYWLGKATQRLARGHRDEARAALDRAFTDPDPAARLRWLAVRWPRQALAESGADALPHLADALLAWPEEAADHFLVAPELPEVWRAGALRVREASALLAGGDELQAMRRLREVGRGPDFRHPQRLLRGLAAWYRRDADAAALALRSLPTTSVCGALAARLMEPAASPSAFGDSDVALVAPFVRALRARKPSQAMVALSHAYAHGSAGLCSVIARDASGGLLALGVAPDAAHARVVRAIPELSAHIESDRLEALVWENGGDCWFAGELWLHNAQSVRPDDPDGVMMVHRAGRLWMRSADAHDPPQRCLDCGVIHLEGQRREEVAQARALFEIAISNAPNRADWWVDLVHCTEWLGHAKERGRVLERFVKAFPEHPVALVRAAEAALDRGSFDKGLRYVRRAAELLPLSAEPVELRARLLIGKARKKYRQGRTADVEAVLEEARGLRRLGVDVRQRLTAAMAAALELTGDARGAAATREAAFEADPRGWLWTLRFVDERRRFLAPRKRENTRFLEVRLDGIPPADNAEMNAVLRLADDWEGDEGLCDHAWAVVTRAVAVNVSVFESVDEARLAMSYAVGPRTALSLATLCCEVDPDNPIYVSMRYHALLDMRASADAFIGAEAELRPHCDDFVGHRYASILDRIEAYVRSVQTEAPAPPRAADQLSLPLLND